MHKLRDAWHPISGVAVVWLGLTVSVGVFQIAGAGCTFDIGTSVGGG